MTRIKIKRTTMTEVLGYFNLSECTDRKKVTTYLNDLADNCKITWHQEDYDTIKIVDLDLDETEIEDITKFLSDYDVIQDIIQEDNDDDFYDSRGDFDDDFSDFGYGDMV
jgi:hypothetical protein